MGMSSSQARLLTFTARMHDIEYKAARLEAQKLQMANESRRVYEDYLTALDKQKFVAKTIMPDGSIGDIPFTANTVYTRGHFREQLALSSMDGKAYIPSSIHSRYQAASNSIEFLGDIANASFTQTIHHKEPIQEYIDQLTKLADDNCHYAQNTLGYIYYSGKETPNGQSDFDKAFKYFQMAYKKEKAE